MKKTAISLIASSVVAGVILTGCGSSSSGGTDSTYTTKNAGKDLYPVVGAQLCLDTDSITGISAGDICKPTDEDGAATFNVTNISYNLAYYYGGQYVNSNGIKKQAPIDAIKAPKDINVINTFTNEIQKKIDNNESNTTDEAVAKIIEDLGLDDQNLTKDDFIQKPSKTKKIKTKKDAIVEAAAEIRAKNPDLNVTVQKNILKTVKDLEDNATEDDFNAIIKASEKTAKKVKDGDINETVLVDENSTKRLMEAYKTVSKELIKQSRENNSTIDDSQFDDLLDDVNTTDLSNDINVTSITNDLNVSDYKAPEANEIATLALGTAKTISIGTDEVTVDEQGSFTHTRDVLANNESLGDFFNISFDADLSSIDANVTDSNATLKASIINTDNNNEISIEMPVQITTTVSDNNNTLAVKVPSDSTVKAFGNEIGLDNVSGTTNEELDLTVNNGTVSFSIDALKDVFSEQTALDNYLANLTQKAGKEGKYLVNIGLKTKSEIEVDLQYTPNLGESYKGLRGTVTLDYNKAQENASKYLENIDILDATKSELETMKTKLQEIIDSSASTQAQIDMANDYSSDVSDAISNYDDFIVSNTVTYLTNTYGSSYNATSDINLPTNYNVANISWDSNNTDVITSEGKILADANRTEDKSAQLDANITYGTSSDIYSFVVNISSLVGESCEGIDPFEGNAFTGTYANVDGELVCQQ